jgi:hypothetical protein
MAMDSRYLTRIGELLVFHRLIQSADALTEENFEDAVMAFQVKEDILVDGIVGPETLWRMQEPWALHNPRSMTVRCDADVVPGIDGFEVVDLRADAAECYKALRQEVRELGGTATSAGGIRSLSDGANANRSAKSMHYTGLAFDLATTSGFFKPETDPFVITRGSTSHWNIWCRAPGGDEMELDSIHWQTWNSGVDLEKPILGHFLNFTALCKKHGFHPIGPRIPFTRNTDRRYLSAEWWHFQANDLLIPKLSQLGIEMMMIEGYTPLRIRAENEGLWANRKAVFTLDWF